MSTKLLRGHVDTTEPNADGRRRRRKHSREFKEAAVRECQRPGVSIASVALAHGLNANLLRRWLAAYEREQALSGSSGVVTVPQASELTEPAAFVPLAVPPIREGPGQIQIELKRGPIAVKVSWPMDSAMECGAWLRELLR